MSFNVGDIIEVNVNAIQPYGAFVIASDGYTGLIHISEISDKFVKAISNFVEVGSNVKVKILEIDEENKHLKLSLKALNQKVREKNVNIHDYRNPNNTKKEFLKLQENLPIWIDKISNQHK